MPSPSLFSRRRRWSLLAAVTALPLLTPGTAALSAPAVAGQPAPATARAAAATHKITLVTGDVVTVTTLADGKQAASVVRPSSATGGVRVQKVKGDLYVLPDEVLPLLAADKLDSRLFDVSDLIEMGYDDAKSGSVPMIATFVPPKTRTAAAPAAPKGSKLTRRFATIGGAALTADKRQTRTFWTSVAPRPESKTFAEGVAKIWLDGRAKVNLKDSVPQIGAPEAWAAGYDGKGVKVAVLDTGIDATHPDLATQIDDKVSFVPGEDTSDLHGHGTHVASTIVGTGAASGGVYKGVAPGADLIVGKVLSNEGWGDDSWILAGMEWAAQSGASVVSMSLGEDRPSDGQDPLSLAVNALSEQYGTLFVIAAGNSGPETIGAPGAAADALTVGAVDKQDYLAYFSATGPLMSTGAIKPDIVAPGVDITAARSQQQNPAQGDGYYWTISGTSMATPHVSGAAAILKQRHPDWSGQQLKLALMSTSKALDYTPFEMGAGRVDVAAAIKADVTSSGSVLFGNFTWPHGPSEGPVTKQVTYTNTGAADVTLNLAVSGDPAFTVGVPSVRVPAGGTATVDVTGDPTAVGYGRFTGFLVGTDAATGKAVARTGLALIKEDEHYDLTIKLVGRDGKPASGTVVVYDSSDLWFPYLFAVDGEMTVRLRPGDYAAEVSLDTTGEKPDHLGIADLVAPQVTLNQARTVTLDASKARLVDTAAPERAEDRQRSFGYDLTFPNGAQISSGYVLPIMYDDFYLSPTAKVTAGAFTMETHWRFGARSIDLSLLGGLITFDATVQPGSALTTGTQHLKAVYAGTGSAADFAKVRAKGRLAVVVRSDAVAPDERAANAAAAGAAALVVVDDGPGRLNEVVGAATIPVATVHKNEGQLLLGFAKAGLPLTVKTSAYTPFTYDLSQTYAGQVPDRSLAYHPRQRDLGKVEARYFNPVDAVEGSGARYDVVTNAVLTFAERELYPSTRTEWVTPGMPWVEVHDHGGWSDTSDDHVYAAGSTTKIDWFAPAARPAFNNVYAVRNQRVGDQMTLHPLAWSSSGTTVNHGGLMDWGTMPTSAKIYQGDTLLDSNDWDTDFQWLQVPSGKLPYHLVVDAARPAADWRLSTRTHTEWDFVSGTAATDRFEPVTLLQLNYQLPTDLHGDVPAGSKQTIALQAVPQPGGSGTGKITKVTLDVSYDDGATWQTVTLRKGADGWWSGDVRLAKKPGGFLSVRASAVSDNGFSISQEIERAYGLR